MLSEDEMFRTLQHFGRCWLSLVWPDQALNLFKKVLIFLERRGKTLHRLIAIAELVEKRTARRAGNRPDHQ